jgi:hypothetical protein
VSRISALVALRRTVVLMMASLVCLLGAGAGLAAADSLPPEGVFESCPLDTQMSTCLQRLQVMQQGGIQVVVINPNTGSLDSLTQYAQAAHSMGMSVMWALGADQGWWEYPVGGTQMDYYSAFAAGCGCTQNGAILDYMIHWLGALQGTYGYYAADDSVLPSNSNEMASYVSRIRGDDPNHTIMIAASLNSQQRRFEGVSDVIGSEIYPVTNAADVPVNQNQFIWNWVGQQASYSQKVADQAGKQSAFILQAFTWGDNLSDGESTGVCNPSDTQMQCYNRLQYPAAAAQLELRNEVLEHSHPKLILWYSFPGTYGLPEADSSSVWPTGSVAAARWQGLSAAIQAPAPSSGGGVGAVASRAHGSHRHHRRHRRDRHHRRHHRHHRHRRRHRRRHHHHSHHRRQAPRLSAHTALGWSPF